MRSSRTLRQEYGFHGNTTSKVRSPWFLVKSNQRTSYRCGSLSLLMHRKMLHPTQPQSPLSSPLLGIVMLKVSLLFCLLHVVHELSTAWLWLSFCLFRFLLESLHCSYMGSLSVKRLHPTSCTRNLPELPRAIEVMDLSRKLTTSTLLDQQRQKHNYLNKRDQWAMGSSTPKDICNTTLALKVQGTLKEKKQKNCKSQKNQKVWCEVTSPRNNREPMPMIPQQYRCLNRPEQ